MTFGERLTKLRKEKGYSTRNELADYLGIPSTTLRNYETDAREPGHSFLVQMSELFDVSVDYLLGVTEERERLSAYDLKSSEIEHIKKYRALDPHGKDMVDTVIDKEYTRSVSDQSNKIKHISNPELAAAHVRNDVEHSEEEIQSDLDMMSDENF